jgi:hypothetical protein
MSTRFPRTVLCLLAAAALTASAVAAGPTPPPAPASPPPPVGRAGRGRGPQLPNSLESAMNEMDRAYKALKNEATDPAKLEQSLKDIAIMQRGAAISKTFLPPMVNRMSPDKKPAALESYRTMMVGLMKTLLNLEEAISSNKTDDIKKGLQQIEETMTKGHGEFIPNGG